MVQHARQGYGDIAYYFNVHSGYYASSPVPAGPAAAADAPDARVV
jgi:hypothetical protein